MQRPDPEKRQQILKVAERLFAASPFHEVKLDEIAAKARIGKGTIYIYFRSKEDVYATLVREGMIERNRRIREQLAARSIGCHEALGLIIRELVDFAFARPGMYQILRTISPTIAGHGLSEHRRELVDIICDVIRAGARGGEVHDPHPELTAEFIVAAVRGAVVFGKKPLTPAQLAAHLTQVVIHGVAGRSS
jgi:AcrR family transcriptional regulator